MRQYLTALSAILLLSIGGASAQSSKFFKSDGRLTSGYRAFVELAEMNGFGGLSLSTTHGYQLNSKFFVGAGVSCNAVVGGSYFGAHANIRYDEMTESKNTPFLDLQVGCQNKHFSVRPAVGYRMNHFSIFGAYNINAKSDNFFSFGISLDFGGRK